MKHITKKNAPAELRRWFEGQKDEEGQYINVDYGSLPTELKQTIHEQLIQEQGALCCYTGRRILLGNSHIEHFLPRTRCHNHEDVAYRNLLAAFGRDRRTEQYGAHAKASWYDDVLLVDPLHKGCEACFRFDRAGKIKPAKSGDKSAKTTIEKLCLSHASLTEMRKQAIRAALPHDIGIKKIVQIADAYCAPDDKGHFRQFCFVIAQVASRSVESAKRRSKQKQSQNKSRKKR